MSVAERTQPVDREGVTKRVRRDMESTPERVDRPTDYMDNSYPLKDFWTD
jgi:hypothetical protein